MKPATADEPGSDRFPAQPLAVSGHDRAPHGSSHVGAFFMSGFPCFFGSFAGVAAVGKITITKLMQVDIWRPCRVLGIG
jgi:hypothetical protein